MKKTVLLLVLLGLVMLTCSKKNITNNYYYGPEEEGASIVGVVYPPESNATVTAYLGIPIASTQIDETGYFKFSNLPEGIYSLLVQAEGYFDHKLSAKLYVANSVIVIDTIYMKSIHDLISSVHPYNGERNVDVGMSIMIDFRSVMDQKSVESAFHIEPSVEGSFIWKGFDPSSPRSYMKFSPRDPLTTSTVYQVTIDTSASDTAGIKLLEPFQFSFTTEPIRVEYTRPAHNDAWVSPLDGISIRFNCLMNMESVESEFELVDSKLNKVEGVFEWQNPMYMRFHPNPVLAAKETYTASVNSTVEDVSGNQMPVSYWFSFTTQPILISAAYPTPNSAIVPPVVSVMIRFNTYMDMESVQAAFLLMDSQQEQVSGNFTWNYPYQINFFPDARLEYNETYTVTIDATAKDLHGKSLDDPFSFWFKTVQE